MAKRFFTLEAARALVPQVRAFMQQAIQLHGHLRAQIGRLDALGLDVGWALLRGERELDDDDAEHHDELERARMLYATLRETVAGIEATGAEVKGVVDGLVDFRSWLDGREEVLLCWKLGEPTIEFFHGLDDGFVGRRSVEGLEFADSAEQPARQEARADLEADGRRAAQAGDEPSAPA